MAQYFIPGFGFIDDTGTDEYLVPGFGFLNEGGEEEEESNLSISTSSSQIEIVDESNTALVLCIR